MGRNFKLSNSFILGINIFSYESRHLHTDEAYVKKRFEIRLKPNVLAKPLKIYCYIKNTEHTTFQIINRYLRFADKADTKRRNDWQINEGRERFIGKNRGEVGLTTKPEPYSYECTLNWLHHQNRLTLKVVSILDALNEAKILPEMIKESKLTDKQEKLIEQ